LARLLGRREAKPRGKVEKEHLGRPTTKKPGGHPALTEDRNSGDQKKLAEEGGAPAGGEQCGSESNSRCGLEVGLRRLLS